MSKSNLGRGNGGPTVNRVDLPKRGDFHTHRRSGRNIQDRHCIVAVRGCGSPLTAPNCVGKRVRDIVRGSTFCSVRTNLDQSQTGWSICSGGSQAGPPVHGGKVPADYCPMAGYLGTVTCSRSCARVPLESADVAVSACSLRGKTHNISLLRRASPHFSSPEKPYLRGGPSELATVPT